ncbi:MAG: phosphoribosylanthranilate isomerase [Victivallales bacterium]|nr:phosphoribosylanthranilate isomerase [Victivallales bacterium]
MLLKFCGITRTEDARFAAQIGANFVGAIIVPGSKREVSPEQAKIIFAAAQPAKGILVVRNMDIKELQQIIDDIRPYAVQLHGNESPEYATQIQNTRIWKAFDVNRLENLQEAVIFPADMIVADSGGGTGRTCDWERARKLAQQRPIMLAGGITPLNVLHAIDAVHPVGIDLAGGVESSPGIKNHAEMNLIVNLVHNI